MKKIVLAVLTAGLMASGAMAGDETALINQAFSRNICADYSVNEANAFGVVHARHYKNLQVLESLKTLNTQQIANFIAKIVNEGSYHHYDPKLLNGSSLAQNIEMSWSIMAAGIRSYASASIQKGTLPESLKIKIQNVATNSSQQEISIGLVNIGLSVSSYLFPHLYPANDNNDFINETERRAVLIRSFFAASGMDVGVADYCDEDGGNIHYNGTVTGLRIAVAMQKPSKFRDAFLNLFLSQQNDDKITSTLMAFGNTKEIYDLAMQQIKTAGSAENITTPAMTTTATAEDKKMYEKSLKGESRIDLDTCTAFTGNILTTNYLEIKTIKNTPCVVFLNVDGYFIKSVKVTAISPVSSCFSIEEAKKFDSLIGTPEFKAFVSAHPRRVETNITIKDAQESIDKDPGQEKDWVEYLKYPTMPVYGINPFIN